MLKFFKYNRHLLNLLLLVIMVGLFAYLFLYESTPSSGRLEGLDKVTPYEPPFTLEGNLVFLKAPSRDTLGFIDIEIADDWQSRSDGLMHRYTLAENQGMLFLFDEEQVQSFWMKNTHISLDIIYVAADFKIVSIARSTTIRSEKGIPSEFPAQYVVEVNAGYCDRHGIEVGDLIEFQHIKSL